MLPKRPLNLLSGTEGEISNKNNFRSNFNLDDSVMSEDEILISDSSLVNESSIVYDSPDNRSFCPNEENDSISCVKKLSRQEFQKGTQGFENAITTISFDDHSSEVSDASCFIISDSDTENEQENSLNFTDDKDAKVPDFISSRNNSRISNISSANDSFISSVSSPEIEMKLVKNKLTESIRHFEMADLALGNVESDILEDKDDIICDMKLAIESQLLNKVSNSFNSSICIKKTTPIIIPSSTREAFLGTKKEVNIEAPKHKFRVNNYGGKLSEQNEQHMVRLTSDAVESFHKMLKSMPNVEVEEEEDPDGLLVNLLPHQRKGLTWLLWRESQLPQGGILADDMGLGKTLTMLSLILREKEISHSICEEIEEKINFDQRTAFFKSSKQSQKSYGKENLVVSSGTLVVCPASLLGQWENEVKVRIARKKLHILVYHGVNRELPLTRLSEYDIVVTTYQQVMQEGSSVPRKNSKKNIMEQGPLFRILWHRIILDEAHQIRNYKSKTSEAVFLLLSKRRWAITGTPIQNKEMDFFSLIKFLRVSPFDNYTCYKHEIQTSSPHGQRKLGLLVRALVLRRTKSEVNAKTGKKIIDLPPRETIIHKIDLTREEREVYDQVFAFSRKSLIEYMRTQENVQKETELFFKEKRDIGRTDEETFTPTLLPNMLNPKEFKIHHMLVLLLRLRQICDHPGLIHSILEEGNDDPTLSNDDIVEQMNFLTLSDNQNKKEFDICIKKKILNKNNPVFQFKNPSSKIGQLVNELELLNEEKQEEKAVIVSQWTSMLNIISKQLVTKGIKFTSITGQVPVKDRSSIVEQFNIKGKSPKILLLSLNAGGVGLNLVGANHLFLCDMHWNPQLETQACDRIYRVGQTLPVTIHKFVVTNSVEEKILELQRKKLDLANAILTGSKMSVSNKLTLQDLKALFSV